LEGFGPGMMKAIGDVALLAHEYVETQMGAGPPASKVGSERSGIGHLVLECKGGSNL
jgi:hypothetical protein